MNLGVSGDSILGIFAKGKTSTTLHLTPSTWGNQRGVRGPSRSFSGAVAGDSTLQDRGVACYLLPLLFSLVSLPFSFCFSILYQKLQFFLFCLPVSSPICLAKHVRIWCFEGIRSSRFPSKGWNTSLERRSSYLLSPLYGLVILLLLIKLDLCIMPSLKA